MSVWEVQGADQKTGKDRVVRVAAPDAPSAERRARAAGMLVASVYAVQVAPAYIPTAPPTHDEKDDVPTDPKHMVHIPSYAPILLASFVLRVFATLSILGGLATLAFTIYAWWKGAPPPGTAEAEKVIPGLTNLLSRANELNEFIAAGAMLMAGAFLYAFAYIGLAIRDMARNSFSV